MLLGLSGGGGGDALAKFEPKDVPTMSMTITMLPDHGVTLSTNFLT